MCVCGGGGGGMGNSFPFPFVNYFVCSFVHIDPDKEFL